MKKVLSVILSLVICVTVFPVAYAVQADYRVFSETLTVNAGDEISVPIKIENNKGFMGFSIIISYDKSVLTPLSVTKGTILTGMLDDSISTSKDNSFKVIFTSSGDIKTDGTLFTVNFKTSEQSSGQQSIKITYSKADTFNEDWQDVTFNCQDVSIMIENTNTTEPEQKLTVWQKIVAFFKKIWNFIKGLVTK